MSWTPNKEQSALLIGCGLALAIILFAIVTKNLTNSNPARTVYENNLEKKRVISAIRIDLLKSIEMEKSAVMALTDQESQAYAGQSRSASAMVDNNLNVLRTMVESVPYEKKLLDEFVNCWTEMGKIDEVILQMAVENTNLKAAALSRDQGGLILQGFEQALETIRASYEGSPEERQVATLTFRAMIAVLKLYNLHSSHIVESNTTDMDLLEEKMLAEERVVMQSLSALGELAGSNKAETVVRAKAAFAEFVAVSNQVVQLSRLNSTIKSMELSLGKKRAVAAQCDDTLAALQESVQQKTFKATK